MSTIEIMSECKRCKDEFHNAKHPNSIYCSRTCANRDKVRTPQHNKNIGLANKGRTPWVTGKTYAEIGRPVLRGKDHHNWKGGLTSMATIIRHSDKYKEWRHLIFKRDDWTCQLCGEKGGRLNADHHPKTYAHIIRDYQITSYIEAMLCRELWSLSNGRTLCVPCHKETPSYLNKHYV